MSKLRVGISAQVFLDWGGGIDLIMHIANALSLNPDYNVYFLAPDSRGPLAIHINNAVELNKIDGSRGENLVSRIKYPKKTEFAEEMEAVQKDLNPNIRVAYFRNTPQGFMQCLRRLRIDVVLPATQSFGKGFPLPWVGYIWDFQHKHFPGFFDKEEIKGREAIFKTTLSEASAILVNSEQIKKEAKQYYGTGNQKIVVMPFAPTANPEWFKIDLAHIKSKYKLPKRFILVSNQFWLHKDHATALDAFIGLAKKGKLKDLHLICTGKMEEPREPEYIARLRARVAKSQLDDRIQFLGYIPKEDQIGIMRLALAVIQPTLYEGGRGGGAATDAVALGVPLILSDIPINLEVKDERVVFFKAGSAKDLAKKIELLLARAAPTRPSADNLLDNNRRNYQRLCAVLSQSINVALKASHKGVDS